LYRRFPLLNFDNDILDIRVPVSEFVAAFRAALDRLLAEASRYGGGIGREFAMVIGGEQFRVVAFQAAQGVLERVAACSNRGDIVTSIDPASPDLALYRQRRL
jgi:hypothetical protein